VITFTPSQSEVAESIGTETEVGPLHDRRRGHGPTEHLAVERLGGKGKECPVDRLDEHRVDPESAEKLGTPLGCRQRRWSAVRTKNPCWMGIEGQRRSGQAEPLPRFEKPGHDRGVAEVDPVEVAHRDRARGTTWRPLIAGGEKLQGGEVLQGRSGRAVEETTE
jgi:hypothetical protein